MTKLLLISTLILLQGQPAATPLSEAIAAINKAQVQQDLMQTTIATQAATIASLQSSDSVALLTVLNAKCPGCAEFLKTNLPNTDSLDGVIILCCGPNTVPSTGPGKQMLYFYTIANTTTTTVGVKP